jgi:UDP-2,4-diacetamido-2,4,6-trideoxy-beta-L-altropyranose hydrolase
MLSGVAGLEDELPHASWLGTSQADDARETLLALSDRTWSLVIIDHYALDFRWEIAVRPAAPRLLAIDDLADRRHDCSLLLDQNLYTDAAARYASKVPEDCRLLLGPRFALLRQQFRDIRGRVVPRTGPVTRVLVCFGGVDNDNHTMTAIEALDTVAPRPAVDVVIGAQHSHRAAIEKACEDRAFACHVQAK